MNTNRFKSKKVAFLFRDGVPASPALLGGKGAGLVELAGMGAPVPEGFTLSTTIARAFAQHGEVPVRMARQLDWSIAALEKETGKTFGGAKNALLVSVRSGAKVSMPGMMDTVLNLGINPAIARGIARQFGTRVAYDCYRRFLQMFGTVVLGVERSRFEEILGAVKQSRGVSDERKFDGGAWNEVCNRYRALIEEATGKPVVEDPRQQLEMAIMAVLRSWNSPRAVEYRQAERIPHSLGTAVNVVSMVYGNRDENSGTGVIFSCNTATGEPGVWGEFLHNAQGEDVVAGVRTPEPISAMASTMPSVYAELVGIVEMLAKRRKHEVDVEFTVESGKLYILQVRGAKLSPEAAVTVAVRNVWQGEVTKEKALASVTAEQLAVVQSLTFEPAAYENAVASRKLAVGLPASPGCAVGVVVTTSQEAVAAKKRGEKVILVRPDTCPSDLSGMIAAEAVVTMTGGYTSHAGVVARGMGKPCVVAAAGISVKGGDLISVDAKTGVIMSGRVEMAGPANKKEVNIFLKWVREAKAKLWRKPRLVFDLYHQSMSAQRMIADFFLADALCLASAGSQLEAKAKVVRTRIHTEVAERLALYLVVAVGGEIRHAKREWIKSRSELAALVADFDTQLGGLRGAAQEATLKKLRPLGLPEHVRYVELVATVFEQGSWSSSVGGPKWAVIARAALGFLKGEYPHSVFADHAFDLQHNNGSVFGKNPMIGGDRYRINQQLEDKKHLSNVTELYDRMRKHCSPGYGFRSQSVLDAEVEQLYSEGLKLGLWAEPVREEYRPGRNRGSGIFAGPPSGYHSWNEV